MIDFLTTPVTAEIWEFALAFSVGTVVAEGLDVLVKVLIRRWKTRKNSLSYTFDIPDEHGNTRWFTMDGGNITANRMREIRENLAALRSLNLAYPGHRARVVSFFENTPEFTETTKEA